MREEGYEDEFSGLNKRRRGFASNRSISMATMQAQVTIAQSIRDMFQAARTDSSSTDGGDVSMENAWLQAVYNSVVILIVSVVVFVLIAVYFVLEPFLHPLLWAVLGGILLHPFKHSATDRIEKWLTSLEEASVPLAAGIFISPFAFFNYLSSQIELYITEYFKHFLVLLGTIVGFYVAVTFNLLDFFFMLLEVANIFFNYMDHAISFQWLVQVSNLRDIHYGVGTVLVLLHVYHLWEISCNDYHIHWRRWVQLVAIDVSTIQCTSCIMQFRIVYLSCFIKP